MHRENNHDGPGPYFFIGKIAMMVSDLVPSPTAGRVSDGLHLGLEGVVRSLRVATHLSAAEPCGTFPVVGL